MTDEERKNIYSRMTLKSRVMHMARKAYCMACRRKCEDKCDKFTEFDKCLYEQTKEVK